MNRQTTDQTGNTDVNTAAPAAFGMLQSGVGVVMLAVPTTGQAQPGEHERALDAVSQARAGVVERFETVRARLHSACSSIDCGAFRNAPGKPTTELAGWSDW